MDLYIKGLLGEESCPGVAVKAKRRGKEQEAQSVMAGHKVLTVECC